MDEDNVQPDLVARAQQGDRRAFSVLVEASIDGLYNLAQLMLADGDLAQDAVQETLISAWRDLRALRDPERFVPWLRQILVRSVYRAAGHERRRVVRLHLASTGLGVVPDATGDFENRDAIDRAFRRLTPEHRAALVVHHYLGLSDTEAAELLGVPPGTFKSRLHRATAAVRAGFEADARTGEPMTIGASR